MHESSCLSSFVEIAFAVNLLTGAFENFRGFLVRSLKSRNTRRISTIKTLEVAEERARSHLPVFVADMEAVNEQYDVVQAMVCRVARAVAIVFAIVCVCVVFFDGLGCWNGVLIAPYPVYVLASMIVYVVYRLKARQHKKRHEYFLNHYEGQSAANARKNISKDLDLLK